MKNKPLSDPALREGNTRHGVRAHSPFSASGAERWFSCPGSVALSEGVPDKSSPWAKEGTRAHEVLESVLLRRLGRKGEPGADDNLIGVVPEMLRHAHHAANVIQELATSLPGSEVMVETRVYLSFIHPEMFGTFDSAVVDHFGTLHVFDYKYGANVAVGPKENLQMIFYGIGVAHLFHWNFKRVRLWIIQPRIRNYEGPLFWDVSVLELKKYVDLFRAATERVEREPNHYVEGAHCYWCKAKSICPLKREGKITKAKSIFSLPLDPESEDFY